MCGLVFGSGKRKGGGKEEASGSFTAPMKFQSREPHLSESSSGASCQTRAKATLFDATSKNTFAFEKMGNISLVYDSCPVVQDTFWNYRSSI